MSETDATRQLLLRIERRFDRFEHSVDDRLRQLEAHVVASQAIARYRQWLIGLGAATVASVVGAVVGVLVGGAQS